MMKLGTTPNLVLAMTLSLAAAFACGGGDDGSADKDNQLGDANQLDNSSGGTGGSSSSVTLPEVCQRQSDCPSGYICMPPAESFTTALDQPCYDACSSPCVHAGPFAATCEQDCNNSCTVEVPPPDGSLNGRCMVNPENQGGGGSSGSGNTDPGGNGGSSNNNNSPSIQWANTWTVDVKYTADCNWANTAHNSGEQSYTVTMQVTGSNSSPQATLSGGYELEGTGGDDRMTLTGDFPLRSCIDGVIHSGAFGSFCHLPGQFTFHGHAQGQPLDLFQDSRVQLPQDRPHHRDDHRRGGEDVGHVVLRPRCQLLTGLRIEVGKRIECQEGKVSGIEQNGNDPVPGFDRPHLQGYGEEDG